jgi:hypothetical protein
MEHTSTVMIVMSLCTQMRRFIPYLHGVPRPVQMPPQVKLKDSFWQLTQLKRFLVRNCSYDGATYKVKLNLSIVENFLLFIHFQNTEIEASKLRITKENLFE